jgi:RNA polymerase sigma-70 factor (ECF subfamily)
VGPSQKQPASAYSPEVELPARQLRMVEGPVQSAPESCAPAAGSTHAFEAVFTAHAPHVMRILPRLGVSPNDVEDVCQEVFVVVLRALPGFEGRSTLRTWVYGICLRVARNHRDRAFRKRERASDQLDEHAAACRDASYGDAGHGDTGYGASGHAFEARIDEQRALARLDQALSSLSAAQREAFVLHAVADLDVVEIAKAQGASKFTVYGRLYAAKKQVTRYFESSTEVKV